MLGLIRIICAGCVVEQVGLDRELLEDMLEAMDGDAAAVTAMLREQMINASAGAAAQREPEPEPEPELSDEALAERYLAGGGGGGGGGWGSESRVEEGEAPGVSAAMRQAEIMVRRLPLPHRR